MVARLLKNWRAETSKAVAASLGLDAQRGVLVRVGAAQGAQSGNHGSSLVAHWRGPSRPKGLLDAGPKRLEPELQREG